MITHQVHSCVASFESVSMTDNSENLLLPYIMPSQAQKHVTHNEAIRMLDVLVQLKVESDALAAPPAGPDAGTRFIVGENPIGVWAGKLNQVAAWQDSAWAFFEPKAGWIAYVSTRDALVVFNGNEWVPVTSADNTHAPIFGINTTADTSNRFAAKTDAVLFSHDDVTPGSGDIRFTLNKADSAKTSSLLFKTNWSGRAEFGLSDDDNIALKVSNDGTNWNTAFSVDKALGVTRFDKPIRLGGSSAAHDFGDYCEGDWTPILGDLATKDYNEATGLSVKYARFTKVGRIVTLTFAFTVEGVADIGFTQKSSLLLQGLPYPVLDLHSPIDQGSCTGLVYKSFGAAINTALIGGFVATDKLYICAMVTGDGEADVGGVHYATASYITT